MQENPFKINDKVYTFNDPDPYFITYISKPGICTLSTESGSIKLLLYWEKLSFTPVMPNYERPFDYDMSIPVYEWLSQNMKKYIISPDSESKI